METKYTLCGKEFELRPLKGKRDRRAIPQILELAAALVKFALDSGQDVAKLFSENETPPVESLAAMVYQVAVFLGDKYDEIEEKIFPVLLCLDNIEWQFVSEEAMPGELYKALWIAIKYHYETSFGMEVQEALKNLPRPPQGPAEEPEA